MLSLNHVILGGPGGPCWATYAQVPDYESSVVAYIPEASSARASTSLSQHLNPGLQLQRKMLLDCFGLVGCIVVHMHRTSLH